VNKCQQRRRAQTGSDGTFTEVIGGSRWRSEWYDVYFAPGGALCTDVCDPLTLVEVRQVPTVALPTSSDSLSSPSEYFGDISDTVRSKECENVI
jgi:hypothetical protein